GQPEAAREDRRDHRRHAVSRHRRRGAGEALSGDPRRSGSLEAEGGAAALRRALSAVRRARARAGAARDPALADALPEIPVSNFGNPHLIWLLAIVPALIVSYAFDGQRRRRLYERIGHLPMIRRMTASYSPARRR